MVGISVDTLRKYYSHELTLAKAETNDKVARNLYQIATGEGQAAARAAEFWLKCQARWKTTDAHEISGPNGGPIQLQPVDAPKQESYEEWKQRKQQETIES